MSEVQQQAVSSSGGGEGGRGQSIVRLVDISLHRGCLIIDITSWRSPAQSWGRGGEPTLPGPGRRAAFLDRYLYLANINTQYHQYLQENTPEGSLTPPIYASTLG